MIMDWWMIIGSALVLAAVAFGLLVLFGLLRANGGDTPAEEMDQRLEVAHYERKREDHGSA